MNKQLTTKECIELLKKNDTPRNIFLHSRKVNAVSMLLAIKLKEVGEDVDLDLVSDASLLHDIKKFESLGKSEIHHVELGETYLKELGYEKIADVVGKHGGKKLKEGLVNTWEEKIINYSDARVMHDEIVSLDERFEDLNKRYEKTYPNVIENNKIIIKLKKDIENEIFGKININPKDITENTIKKYLIEDDY